MNAAGEWGPIYVGTEECRASEGDAITFTVDGQAATADPAVTFTAGGAPAEPAVGIILTVDEVDDEEPPAPAPTGNADLVGGMGSTSMALVMLLGVLGAALLAGARVATRRS